MICLVELAAEDTSIVPLMLLSFMDKMLPSLSPAVLLMDKILPSAVLLND
jgi:hypothetical protein